MFDTIMGLPLHPLVVHAVVILAPTAALFALAYAALARSRRALWWPTLALTVVATGAALVAKESGERLANRVFTSLDSTAAGYAEKVKQVTTHTDAGSLMAKVMVAFFVLTVLAMLTSLRPHRRAAVEAPAPVAVAVPAGDDAATTSSTPSATAAAGGGLGLVLRVLVVIAALAVLAATAVAGHSGATAVWSSIING